MSQEDGKRKNDFTRRDFIKAATVAGTAAIGLGSLKASEASPHAPVAATAKDAAGSPPPGGKYNILFILSDQEHYLPDLIGKGHWPGRDRLSKMGTTFTNHQICAAVCTPSRSVIFTGQHIQHTRMFDNTNFPWVSNMSYDIPTIGHMLRQGGYYTTYQGKWHLHEQMHEHFGPGNPVKLIGQDIMEKYGFSDFTGIGDEIGMRLGGYHYDEFVTATTQTWLRTKGKSLNQDGKPWFLTLGLVQPHDVMFYDTDTPGKKVQAARKTISELNRDPDDKVYKKRWRRPLSASRKQAWDAPGRPKAHREYQKCRAFLTGKIPNEDARWQRLQDYYLNCISDGDRSVDRILGELDTLGMLSNTIVIFTSDHGELCGAHGMSGKGSTAYQEQNHVPFIVYHPAISGGKTCQAVTSHLDIVPTILNLAGVEKKVPESTRKKLHGKDMSGLLAAPGKASLHAVRNGALYNFSMWCYLDSDWLGKITAALAEGKKLTKETAPRPTQRNRGAIRTVFDGRYKFSRYFSMTQHNRPQTMEQIFKANDVELYDLEKDPHERKNLSSDKKANGELILAMNEKLNAIIAEEVGEDNGKFLPKISGVNWAFQRFDPLSRAANGIKLRGRDQPVFSR